MYGVLIQECVYACTKIWSRAHDVEGFLHDHFFLEFCNVDQVPNQYVSSRFFWMKDLDVEVFIKNKKHRVTIPCKWSFDFMKSGGFHMKSSKFDVKSTQNLIKENVSTKTIQFDECRRGAMNQDFMKSWVIAPSLHPPNWRVFVETSDFIRFWVDFTWNLPDVRWNPLDPLDFMNVSFWVMIKYRSFFRKTNHFYKKVMKCSLFLNSWIQK